MPRRSRTWALIAVLTLAALVSGCGSSHKLTQSHTVKTTMFWVGESPGPDNHYISNAPSVWQNDWQSHYGGADDPAHRNGLLPAGFVPKENPFYFALPYSDYTNGERKQDLSMIPWPHDRLVPGVSAVKNRWIAVTYKNKTVYGQWEDAGPLGENDVKYVFGTAKPRFANSGLDISPAMSLYLGFDNFSKTKWQFIEESNVPPGPWRQIITRSQIDWG